MSVYAHGQKMIRKWYHLQPHYTVKFSPAPGCVCHDIEWQDEKDQWHKVKGGHWRNYEGWGPNYYQLTKSFLGRSFGPLSILIPPPANRFRAKIVCI